jgi:flagellar assembly protein FliH
VLAWLASQSVETRGACAQALAPDIHALAAAAEAEGLERGRAAGLREVESRAASALAALARLVASAEESLRLESAQLAESCTEIVAEAFVKLAGPRLASREAVVGAVLTVLARVKDERELTIRVNGADLPLLEAEDSGLRAALGSRRWTLTADSRVAIGGCLVESALGTLDGRIDVQLHELGETLRAAKNARLESA